VKDAILKSPRATDADGKAANGHRSDTARKSVLSWIAMTSILSGVVLASVFGLATHMFGSVPSAVAFLRGNRIIPDSYIRDFGTLRQGQRVSVTFSLTNYTKQPITLLGAKSSCSCLAASDLPVVVPPGAKTDVRFTARAKSRLGPYSEIVHVLVDGGRPSIALNVRGVVKSGSLGIENETAQ
jgi:hypothetical protein